MTNNHLHSVLCLAMVLCLHFLTVDIYAEDGSRLWLSDEHPSTATNTLDIANDELRRFYQGSLPASIRTTANAPANDGYRIVIGRDKVIVESQSATGALYGTYALLRQQAQYGTALYQQPQTITSTPACSLRVLNHWDNPNGTIERGFAGHSIFWGPDARPDRWQQYARANASIGINATVLNNVNAKPEMLSDSLLQRTRAIANVLRPYGIRVYLSVNFASPKALGGLDTADPLDPRVRQWWKTAIEHIYQLIPDFGGFLVKANSEGEPGPMDYGRTHVDGANMLAEALLPHGGIVMWRSFVYAANSNDRAAQAYDEFMPLDGLFAPNVIIQIKNGPIDFQPREPVSPLLMSMLKTKTMMELQVTQEYLGESIHTVFLASMWNEAIATLQQHRTNKEDAIVLAGVANIGNDANWCGSITAQANWYAFGRMAWNPYIAPIDIADEWIAQTFPTLHQATTADGQRAKSALRLLLLRSHEAAVNYMMPMGLHHIFAGNHHYGPEPWYHVPGTREDWLPRYYHKANADGIGFDRTTATGSGSVAQYPTELQELYESPQHCPKEFILWFHHLPWNHPMADGSTLWQSLCQTYDQGVREAESFVDAWQLTAPYIDSERWQHQQRRFRRQALDAWWWRDACLLYFQQFSKQPLPASAPAPRHQLDDLMRYKLHIDNYTCAPIDALP